MISNGITTVVCFFAVREGASQLEMFLTEKRTEIKFCFAAEINSGDMNHVCRKMKNIRYSRFRVGHKRAYHPRSVRPPTSKNEAYVLQLQGR